MSGLCAFRKNRHRCLKQTCCPCCPALPDAETSGGCERVALAFRRGVRRPAAAAARGFLAQRLRSGNNWVRPGRRSLCRAAGCTLLGVKKRVSALSALRGSRHGSLRAGREAASGVAGRAAGGAAEWTAEQLADLATEQPAEQPPLPREPRCGGLPPRVARQQRGRTCRRQRAQGQAAKTPAE